MVSLVQRPAVIPFALFALAALALPGCTDVKRGLGMEKVVPDEFAVTATAPLAVPPDFSLRPPQPGAAPTQTEAPVDQARQTVFRVGDSKLETLEPGGDAAFSPGEGAFLKQAGAEAAPKNIRQLVSSDEKNQQSAESFTDKLLFWKSSPPAEAPSDQTIDPSFEAQRLRQASAAASGSATASAAPSPTASAPSGITGQPTIERTQDKGFWHWLF